MANNLGGSATSDTVTVKIHPLPIFTKTPAGQTYNVGGKGTLAATVSGNDTQVQWLRDGLPLSEDSPHTVTDKISKTTVNTSLKFAGLTTSDNGIYPSELATTPPGGRPPGQRPHRHRRHPAREPGLPFAPRPSS